MRRRFHIPLATMVFAAALAGCADQVTPSCVSGLQRMTKAELLFGRAIPGSGQVGDDDWRRFVDEVVTPRFPEGLTIQDAAGQWKGASGIVHEPSKLMMIVFADTADAETKLNAIRRAYKERFHQDSVLVIETPVCTGF